LGLFRRHIIHSGAVAASGAKQLRNGTRVFDTRPEIVRESFRLREFLVKVILNQEADRVESWRTASTLICCA
jgi:hypothetical protein